MTGKKREFFLDPPELKAIEEHKWYLSERAGGEISIDEAIVDFRQKYRRVWLRAKLLNDNLEQIDEIIRYRWCRSEAEGRDIGKERATMEWIQSFAALWRREKESVEANGFKVLKLTVDKDRGLCIKPASKLAEIARRFDCDIYLHMCTMEFYNFILNGKPYLNIKSIICPYELTADGGDEMDIIATGTQAGAALAALKIFLMV